MTRRVVLIVTLAALVISASALALPFTGTPGDDDLRGTNGSDRISGGPGNDTIEGLGSADVLLGGPGMDRILGGRGRDRITGHSGHDTLSAGPGDGTIRGRSGNDTIDGDTGKDRLAGDAGIDRIRGGDGDDTITGGFDNDGDPAAVAGDRFFLQGGSGDDRISGGPGNDWLIGDAGHDDLFGDEEDDVIEARDGERDVIDCGDGLADVAGIDFFEVAVVGCERLVRPPPATPFGAEAVVGGLVNVRVLVVSTDAAAILETTGGVLKPIRSDQARLFIGLQLSRATARSARISPRLFSLIDAGGERTALTSRSVCGTEMNGLLDIAQLGFVSVRSRPVDTNMCVIVPAATASQQILLVDVETLPEPEDPPGVSLSLTPPS